MSALPAGAPPRWAVVPALLGTLLVLLPVAALLLRLQWSRLPHLLTSQAAVEALTLSVWTALAATLTCVLLGVPLALWLAHARFRGVGAVRSVILLPLVLPPVVGGLALLYTFGRQGLLGGAFDLLGVQVAYTSLAVVLAQTFVAMPFLVISVETAVRGLDREVLDAAAVDGAGRTGVLRHITVPLILPGLVAGAVLAFARSLGEFGATLAFAGSVQGVTRTVPLEIYLQRETDPDAAIALSILLIGVAVVVISLAYGRHVRRAAAA